MAKGSGGLSEPSNWNMMTAVNNAGSKKDLFGGDTFGSLANARNDIFGITDQAKYAQKAAEAEQKARQAVTTEARAGADRMRLAAQSPQQLAALESGLSAAQTQVQTDLRQLAAIDPAIMEASKQVLDLLQGKQAALNDPAMKQRTTQRDQLVNSLRSQYGPGAESTSIGQRALQQFDQQTATMFQQNQMNSLHDAFGIASTRVQGPGMGQLLNVSQGFGNYQDRQLQAEGAGTQGILNAMTGEVQGAGAQYTGDLLKSGARRQWFTSMEDDGRQIGRTWATMGAGGKGGGNMSNAGQSFNAGSGGDSSSSFWSGSAPQPGDSYNSHQYRNDWNLNTGGGAAGNNYP